MNDPYRLEPCPPCPPFWVATKTYVAECIPPKVSANGAVSKTRQFRSTISLEHAESEALRLAKEAAEAELDCYWTAEAGNIGSCGYVARATGTSHISQEDAHRVAVRLALQKAEYFCQYGVLPDPDNTGSDLL